MKAGRLMRGDAPSAAIAEGGRLGGGGDGGGAEGGDARVSGQGEIPGQLAHRREPADFTGEKLFLRGQAGAAGPRCAGALRPCPFDDTVTRNTD